MVEGGDEPFESIVWACPECGREHQKHSPPCSRCGHVSLEKQRKVHADVETPGGTSYLDVLEFKYAVGYLAVFAFGAVVVLSLAGVISVPWLGGPSPPGAPGDATTYGNVSLSDVEAAFVADVNELRRENGVRPVSVEPSLDDAATAFNQRRVRSAGGEGDAPDMATIFRRYEPQCSTTPLYDTRTASAGAVFGASDGVIDARTVASRLPIAPSGGRSDLAAGEFANVGVDVHVGPDDTVYATVVVC